MGEDFGGEFCMPIISIENMESEAMNNSYLNRVIFFNNCDYEITPQKKEAFSFEAKIEDQSESMCLLLSTLFGNRFERTLSRAQ